jgi:hypothetical protein
VPGLEPLIAITIIVVGGLVLSFGKRALMYVIDALAAALVKSINGQLGLDGIRKDVSGLKVQVENLEGQLEQILTDL